MKKGTDNKQAENTKLELEQYKAKYLRALADYQNLEKRVRNDRQQIDKYSSQRIVVKLLPIVDDLEKAEKHIHDQGLTLIINRIKHLLNEEGVVKIEVLNKKFNPVEMECTEVVESDKEDEVIEEVRPGYKLEDKVIRVAQVKVGKKKVEARAEEMAKK